MMDEVFDYKRFVLLNIKRIPIILLFTVIASVIAGVVYYAVAILCGGPDTYRATAMYYITFDTEEYEEVHTYYNAYTWNTVVDSDLIAGEAAKTLGISMEEIADMTLVPTMSDIRFISLYVDDIDSDKAAKVLDAVGAALIDFSKMEPGFESIEQWDGPHISIVPRENFTIRLMIVGGILGLVAGVLVVLYKNAMDTRVYTYEDCKKNTGIMPAGMIFKGGSHYSDDALKDNLHSIANGKEVKLVYASSLNGQEASDFDIDAFNKALDIKATFCKSSEIKPEDIAVMLVRQTTDVIPEVSRAVDNANIRNIKIKSIIITEADSSFYKGYYHAFAGTKS